MGNTPSSTINDVTSSILSPESADPRVREQQFMKEATKMYQSYGNTTSYMPSSSASTNPLILRSEKPVYANVGDVKTFDLTKNGEPMNYRYTESEPDHDCGANCPCIKGQDTVMVVELMGGRQRGGNCGFNMNKMNDSTRIGGKDDSDDESSSKKKDKKKKKQKKEKTENDSDSDSNSLSDDFEEVELNLDDIPSSDEEESGGIFGENSQSSMRRNLRRLMDSDTEKDYSKSAYDDDNLVGQQLSKLARREEMTNSFEPSRNLKSKFFGGY